MLVINPGLGDIDRFLEPAVSPAHRVGVNSVSEILVDTDIIPPNSAGVRIAARPGLRAMYDAQFVLPLAIFL